MSNFINVDSRISLITFSPQEEIASFLDPKFLKLLLIEHKYKKKSIESISKSYGIPALDLKFFFQSAEAITLYKELETAEDPSIYKNQSIEELKEIMIEKLNSILNTSSNRDVIDAVDRITPRIIEIERVLQEKDAIINNPKRNSIFDIPTEVPLEEGFGYEVVLDTQPTEFDSIETVMETNEEKD